MVRRLYQPKKLPVGMTLLRCETRDLCRCQVATKLELNRRFASGFEKMGVNLLPVIIPWLI